MGFLFQACVFLHIIAAAAWFGLGLRLASQARAALAGEREVALALCDDAARAVRLMGIFIVLAFVFSMGALGLGGGYSGQFQYHTASMLIVVLIVVQYGLIRPAWNGLRAAITSSEDGVLYSRRVAMTVGIGHLIWLILLTLMFWNRFKAVLLN